MPDERADEQEGLFGSVFSRGGADVGDTAWLRAMLAVEAALARATERAGLAPAGSGTEVTRAAAAGFDTAELGRLATLTGNPVPGLARTLARKVTAPVAARAVHRGASSQDIIDTAAMLLARQALDATRADLERAADGAAHLAKTHQASLMVGRTMLQQAVPVTFGVVAAGWLAGLDAAIDGLTWTRDTRLAVQFGGAAGTLASLGADGARVKALLATELGLPDPPLPWHTERLRIIDVAVAMARVTAALGKIARDVTLLAQPEIAEVRESVGGGAPPASATPVAAIAIIGCARQVPGLLATVVASAEQEHQRAAGAWHAEWQPFAGILRLASSAAAWGADLLTGLHVDTSKMAANLSASGGLPLAERVMGLLATELGGPQAHDLVAGAAARAASSGLPLRDVLLAAPELEDRLRQAGITAAQIEAALDPAGYLGSSAGFIEAALAAHDRSATG
ncbi:MAG TPA: lyase family protein [Trebonia sp.]|jgi:3-carboxy-cis,cis-muconate cycloisomerase|nr:lyase family protein [Trebonia sp.]